MKEKKRKKETEERKRGERDRSPAGQARPNPELVGIFFFPALYDS
jgi:hypothetical protein